ncbi:MULTISPECIES: MSHA biogenesis protein MshI [unclassified Photobacterium]|uniref:MSHA biogenesis protein MshI n=1 Tax=unclassified Photobacterium TaxID=2628852 RepID=UPI001EDFC79C|nr:MULTISPECIES: MSHA biogenesis protein MshI [unclassified Photobacterium]MCG3862849.1 MSHA biogenesis protein MshI [Photobacterium sp. Ph6]MCG3874286.1 MSHA biogenesis protein MshI [Photobacterium sp. Ph5]
MKNVFSKLFQRASFQPSAALVFYSDTVVLVQAKTEHFIVDRMGVSNVSDWSDAARNLITQYQLSGTDLKLVLGHGLYQSLVIDKPEVSIDELPTALPFLVKDLVNESPSELVADGFPATAKDRLQVFVASKQLITQVVLACHDCGCHVSDITTEDIAWSRFSDPNRSQLILHADADGNLQLTAFNEQMLCFQRQLRGFTLPLFDHQALDGGSFQLDNLALELQRSLDFISAQLRNNPISQLIISCDNEDNQALADELNKRLNINVEAIQEVDPLLDTNAARLGWAALQRPKDAIINLYSDNLLPTKQWMTLSNIVASWIALIAIFAIWAGWNTWQNTIEQKKLAQQTSLLSAEQQKLDHARVQVAALLSDPLKVNESHELEKELAAKRATLKVIEEHDDSLKVGYAGLLQQLADAASGDISVQHIYVSGTSMDLSGLARNPDAVPRWVGAFKTYPSLAERRFQMMSLGRNDKNVVTFQLQAERKSIKGSEQ